MRTGILLVVLVIRTWMTRAYTKMRFCVIDTNEDWTKNALITPTGTGKNMKAEEITDEDGNVASVIQGHADSETPRAASSSNEARNEGTIRHYNNSGVRSDDSVDQRDVFAVSDSDNIPPEDRKGLAVNPDTKDDYNWSDKSVVAMNNSYDDATKEGFISTGLTLFNEGSNDSRALYCPHMIAKISH